MGGWVDGWMGGWVDGWMGLNLASKMTVEASRFSWFKYPSEAGWVGFQPASVTSLFQGYRAFRTARMAIHQKRIEAMTSELHRKPLQDWGSI